MSFVLTEESIPISHNKIEEYVSYLNNVLQNPKNFSVLELTDAYQRCGIAMFYNGSYRESIQYLTASFKIKDFLAICRIDSYCYILLGLAYVRLCDLNLAEESFIKSVSIARLLPRKYENTRLLSLALDNLALVRMNLKNYIDAVNNVNEAINLTEKTSNDYIQHIRVLISIYIKMNVFTKVEDIVNENDFDETERALIIGGCKFANGKFIDARKFLHNTKYFKSNLMDEKNSENPNSLNADLLSEAQVKFNLSLIEMNSDNFHDKSYLKESLDLLTNYIEQIEKLQASNINKIINDKIDVFNYNSLNQSSKQSDYPNITNIDNIMRPYIILTQIIIVSVEYEFLKSIHKNSISLKLSSGYIVKDSNRSFMIEDKVDSPSNINHDNLSDEIQNENEKNNNIDNLVENHTDRYMIKETNFYEELLEHLERVINIFNAEVLDSYSNLYKVATQQKQLESNNQMKRRNSMDDSIDSQNITNDDKFSLINSSFYDIMISNDMIMNYQQLIKQLLCNQYPIAGLDNYASDFILAENNNETFASEALELLKDRYNLAPEIRTATTTPLDQIASPKSTRSLKTILPKTPTQDISKPVTPKSFVSSSISENNYDSKRHDMNSIRSELLPLIIKYGRDDVSLWIVWAISSVNGIGYGVLGVGTNLTAKLSNSVSNILSNAAPSSIPKSQLNSPVAKTTLFVDTSNNLSSDFLRLLQTRLVQIDKDIQTEFEKNQSTYLSTEAEGRYLINIVLIKVQYLLNLKRDIHANIILIENIAKHHIRDVTYLALVRKFQIDYEEYVVPTLGPEKRFVFLANTILPLCKQYIKCTEECSDFNLRHDSYKRIINIYIELSKLPVPITNNSLSSSSTSSYHTNSINYDSFAPLEKLESFYNNEDMEILETTNFNWLREYSKARAKQWSRKLRELDNPKSLYNRAM